MRVFHSSFNWWFFTDVWVGASLLRSPRWGNLHGVLANVLDCNIVVSEFELQLCNIIHFWTNTLEKGMNPFIPLAMG